MNDDVDQFFAEMIAQENKKAKQVQTILRHQYSKDLSSPFMVSSIEGTKTIASFDAAGNDQEKSISQSTVNSMAYTFNSCQELLQSMQRDINCLTSPERSNRFDAFTKLKKFLLSNQKEYQIPNDYKHFLFPHILPQLLKCLNTDSIESCRENAALLLLDFLKLDYQVTDEHLSLIIPVLEARLNYITADSVPRMGTQFVESSEEVRLLLNRILTIIIKRIAFPDKLSNYIDSICHIIGVGYSDYHEIKIEACSCTIVLCQLLPSKIVALFSPSLLKSLKPNLSHQRSAVREAAIHTVNMLVMNGGHNFIEELFTDGIMKKLIVDSSPIVRQSMIETLRNWSLNLADRWSYQFQVLYCICVALTDEIPVIRQIAKETLMELGQLHEQENDSEVNDIKVYDVDHKISNYSHIPLPEPFYERPSLGCRMLVTKHAKKMIATIIDELTNWYIPKRLVAAKCLQRIILLCEKNIVQHLQMLVNQYFRVKGEEEAVVSEEIDKAIVLTGYFSEPDTYIPIVWSYLKPEYATSPILLSNVLYVYSLLIQGANPMTTNWQVFIEGTMSALSERHFLIYGEQNRVKSSCLRIVESILECSKMNQVSFTDGMSLPLFAFIIRLCAQRTISKELTIKGISLLEELTNIKKLPSIAELYSIHFNDTLKLIIVDMDHWDKTSPNLYSFECLIKHGANTASKYLDIIMPAFTRHLSPNSKDLHATLVLFASLNQLLANIATSPMLTGEYLAQILSIIRSNIVWRNLGMIYMQIRKIAVACLNCLLRQGTFRHRTYYEQLQYLRDEMFNELVSCLDETDDLEMRIITMKAFIDLVPLLNIYLVDDQWQTLSLAAVERLEDANQTIRIDACQVLESVLALIPSDGDVEKERNSVQMILKALLIHLDDPDPSIRSSIYKSLVKVINFCVDGTFSQVKNQWILDTINQEVSKKVCVARNSVREMSDLIHLTKNLL